MKKIKILFLVTFALMLSGCGSSVLDRHVTKVGKMGDIEIVDIRSMMANNLLVAQATLHNTGKKIQTGFYRCQFYDVNKMQVGEPQVWQSVTIYANEDQAIKCMATQMEALNFKVEFSADGKNVSVFKYS